MSWQTLNLICFVIRLDNMFLLDYWRKYLLVTYFQITKTAMKTRRPRSTEHKTITADCWREGLLRRLASIN